MLIWDLGLYMYLNGIWAWK